MATIRKRRCTSLSGEIRERWQVDFVDQDGTRRHKQFERKRDADNYVVHARGQVAVGTYVAESTSSTIRDAADAWVRRGEAKQLERSTIRQRRQHIAHILAVLAPDTRLARISVSKLEAARDDLLLRHSIPTTRKIIVSLRAILKQAKATHLATADLGVSDRRHRKRLKVGVDIPDTPEIKALVGAASGRALALVCLAAFAGLRASELRGLRWSDLTLAEHPSATIHQRADRWSAVGAPKSEAAKRTVPLNETTAQAVREWKLEQPPVTYRDGDQKQQRPATLVFGTGADRPDGLANIRRRVLEPVALAAGVTLPVLDAKGKPAKDRHGKPVMRPKYSGLHCLRHFAVSAWLRTCNGDFKRVQAWAGHASLVMTLDRYGHLLEKGR